MPRPRAAHYWTILFLLLPAAVAAAQPEPPATIPEGFFEALEYRHIGPVGNRVIAVTGVPGDANVYLVGAASGGVWKSTDGGHQWRPTFDDQPASSIGALAIAPSDPNVVWAGTGETFIRANISIGNGVYKSTDGGETWRHMGLARSGRIGRVIVHPTDPDIVYAAALGHTYGPQPERGVYRSRDGGETWTRVLFADENSGASDLVMDPTNPRVLFAGTWEIVVNTWSRKSGGPGSGLHVSRDGGDSWTRLAGEGLPEPPWGKVGLTMSAEDPRRVYALIETNSNRDFAPLDKVAGVLWRSDDGGGTWRMVSADNQLVARPLYYSRALAAPDDADEVYFMAPRHSRSLDGGESAARSDPEPGYDHHDMWIDPQNPKRMIVGHDGGISISTNRGASWFRPQLPIAQMYHVNVDDRVPYFVYGNRQDGPTFRGPSNDLTGGEIPIGAWRPVGGCEVGFAVPSPADPNVVWSGCYDGILERHELASSHSRVVSVWPDAVESWPGGELEYRFQWTFPIAVSPHAPRRVYIGSQYVHRTENGGQSWQTVSPDLTTDDPELKRRSGGLTLDDAGPTMAPVIFALAESPLEEGVLWAGTNDGQVQVSRDGGATWSNVTANLPELPTLGTVSNVEPSRHAAGTCYLTVDRHQLGDTDPHVYKTADYGATWRKISGGVPRSLFSYAHCVREDPVRAGLLYLGTENAVYVSFDDGGHWHALQTNLPHTPVHWLTVQEQFNDLVVATYGRGFWILDDITPLQQLAAGDVGAGPVLLAPRPAWRFHRREEPARLPDDPAAGANPEYGASIHYLLGAELDEEASLTLAVLDDAGAVVRTLSDVPRKAGLHRVHWDLRYERTDEVKLRTRPLESPHVEIPAQGWRPLRDGGRLALLAPPGTYTVRLEVGEETWTQPLAVRKDPHATGTEADLQAQMEVLFDLREMVDRAAGLINEIEWLRKQLGDLEERLDDLPEESPHAAGSAAEEVGEAAGALAEQLTELEGRFFDLRLTGRGQDGLRWKRQLYAKLLFLADGLASADYPPTDQQLELFAELSARLADHERRFTELAGEVASFNELLREKDLDGLVAGGS